jgi:ribosomal protein S12 methylthiotransferase accessory factor
MRSGWFQVAFERELSRDVTALEIEKPLIAVRTASAIRVFAAVCPHRGAHLGHGGRLDQDAIETLPDAAYDLVQRFEHTGAAVHLFDLTMDHGIPTVLSVLRGRHADSPALVFAAAAALDPVAATRSALEELAHTQRYSQQIKSAMERLVIDPGFACVVDQVDHLNLYVDHANAGLAEPMFAASRRIAFDEIANLETGDAQADLRVLAARVAAVGHRVLVADLTSPDVRSLGLCVARAVIPGFHPLFMGHRMRALGGARLWQVPRTLGYRGIDPERGDNPAPHPYP